MIDKIEFEEFIKLVKDMRRGFPRWEYRDLENKFTDSQLGMLIKEGYLVEMEPSSDGDGTKHRHFILGSSTLTLISGWETEKLNIQLFKFTTKLHKLTLILVVLGGLAITTGLLQIFDPIEYIWPLFE